LLSLTALLLSLSAYSLLLDSPFTPLSARITNAQFVPPTLVQPAGDGSLSFFGVLGTGIGAMSAALTAQLGVDASATPFDARYYSFYQWTGLTPPEDNVIDSIWFALIGAVAAAVVAAGLLYRHRARCEQLFRLFLVADLFLIFAVGGGSFALCTGALFNTPVDWVWYLLAMANLGACGCFALYGPSEASEKAARGVADDSTRVHAAALLFLNAVMAVMMTSVLNPFIVLLFLLLMALADLVAEVSVRDGEFMSESFVILLEGRCLRE
jgi:hypothetical protein